MKRFEYLEAKTLRQAISILQRHGENVRIMAGSTDFLVRWRAGVWNPDYVINIQRVAGMSRITYSARTRDREYPDGGARRQRHLRRGGSQNQDPAPVGGAGLGRHSRPRR